MRKYYSLATEDRTADIYIFGDITSWEWQESDVSSYTLAKELSELDADNINVHINSYGGEVSEALAIYNTLRRSPAQVTTYVDGFACSAATIVFMAGDKRVMSKVGNFLVHPAWALIQGNADDMRKEAEDLDRITEQSVTAYMEHVTKSREELISLMKEERFMTPGEVLEWGFATEIEGEDDPDNPTQSVRQRVHDELMPFAVAELTTLTAFELTDEFSEDAIDKIAAAVLEKIKAEEPKGEPPQEPVNDDNQEAPKRCFFDAFKKN